MASRRLIVPSLGSFSSDSVVTTGGAATAVEISQAPRPYVPAARTFKDELKFRLNTWALGRPVPKAFQVVPPSVESYTPWSLPMYNVPLAGSSWMAQVGRSGRLPLMSVHVVPPLVVLNTWPPPKVLTTAYAV